MKETFITQIQEQLTNTRYFVCSESKESLVDDLSEKMKQPYGTMHMYFIPDAQTEAVWNELQATEKTDDGIDKVLTAGCQFGCDILDMTLKDRLDGKTTAVRFDVNPFRMYDDSFSRLSNVQNVPMNSLIRPDVNAVLSRVYTQGMKEIRQLSNEELKALSDDQWSRYEKDKCSEIRNQRLQDLESKFGDVLGQEDVASEYDSQYES